MAEGGLPSDGKKILIRRPQDGPPIFFDLEDVNSSDDVFNLFYHPERLIVEEEPATNDDLGEFANPGAAYFGEGIDM